MDDKVLRTLYQNIDFSFISKDTFINSYKIYDHEYFVLSKEETESFNNLFQKFMFKYIGLKKEYQQIIDDLQVLKEEKLSSFTYVDYLLKTKSVELLDDNATKYIIDNHLIPLYYLLYNKEFSKTHEKLFKQLLMNTENGIEFWTNQYDFPKEDKYKYYLPKLNDEEIDELIEKYIKSQYRNPNHLMALMTHKNNKDSYIIKPERFVDLEKAYKECFNDSHMISHKTRGPEIEIGIAEDVGDIPFYEGWHSNHIRYVSSKSFIDKNCSMDKFINILRYSIRLVDIMGRINGVFNPYIEDAMVLLENRTINQYGGMHFHKEEPKRNYHFMSVSGYLFNIGHSIERYLEYVVNDIFNSKYRIQGFKINLLVDGDYKLKCEHLFNEMQGFVKQYDSFLRIGSVSSDLIKHLNFSSYSSIKSTFKNKYYAVNPDSSIIRIFHLLFSYQSSLRHIDVGRDNEMSFSDLILRFDIKKSEYKWKSSLDEIDFLIQNDIVEEVNGLLKLKNLEVISLLKELHEKGFVTYYYLKDKYKVLAKTFLDKGWIKVEDSLLSGLESDYFEYYLSDKKYSGNPAIRNKYGHGATYVRDDESFMDYCIGLRLFTLLIFKVYEEFDIKYIETKFEEEI